jgi:hypothetical protein
LFRQEVFPAVGQEFAGTKVNGPVGAIQKVELCIECGHAERDSRVGFGEVHQGVERSFTFGSLNEIEQMPALVRVGLSPPFPLGVTHAFAGGGTHLPPLAFWTFWRGGGLRAATGEHGPEFGNLNVYPPLLFFEAYNGGIEYFG